MRFFFLYFMATLVSIKLAAQEQVAVSSTSTAMADPTMELDNKTKTETTKESTNINEALKQHKVKVFVDNDQKIYFQKHEDIYLWVSTSESEGSKKYLLVTDDGTKHFRLDTEGKNTIRSPWAIDPETGTYRTPRKDVIFDLYADGMPPTTIPILSGAPKHFKSGKMYYGKGLKMNLKATERVAGLENIYVSMDGKEYSPYTNELAIDQENERSVSYYAVDNVGNVETPNTKNFIVDITAPRTRYKINGISDNNVLSPRATISLSSEDNLSGVKHIKYKIGQNGTYKTYKEPILLASLPDGEMFINYYSVDNVSNTESVRNSNEDSGEAETNMPSKLYLDRTPPTVAVKIIGDHHKAKYDYVSPRSKITLTGTDNRAGVEKITYGISTISSANVYTSEFHLLDKSGIQYINYTAIDKVSNKSRAKSKLIYYDKKSPSSNIEFIGKRYIDRDTLFINKSTQIKLSSVETESGLKQINYQIDEQSNVEYTNLFTIEAEGIHKLNYFGVDKVNNVEVKKEKVFITDNTPPTMDHTFSIEPIGMETINGELYHIFPRNVKIYLAAADRTTGVRSIWYKLNNGSNRYKNIIEYFNPGTFTAEVFSKDMLGNQSSEIIRFKVI